MLLLTFGERHETLRLLAGLGALHFCDRHRRAQQQDMPVTGNLNSDSPFFEAWLASQNWSFNTWAVGMF
jgi:hypothetical protein